MGWEIKNQQFFCNTSDTFFGPYLDESIWPDHDNWCPDFRDILFHEMFNKFLSDNPQKRGNKFEVDPRARTKANLEKVCGQFEEIWTELEKAAEVLVYTAREQKRDALELLSGFHEQTDFTPKKRTKRAAKKKGRK
jgi:hypothetical protein